ncbi:MAG: DNA-binding transcriptional regulator Fis [Gammaproteobacteria bacterium]|nr:DNA-binding transcriptional regulator Fis [Gammaproteobacteria bacterium]
MSTILQQTESYMSFESNNQTPTLQSAIQHALNDYFFDLDDQIPGDLYQLVLGEVEPPLLRAVLNYTQGNQSKAAEVLGINRGTLRKKLKEYGINQ